MNKFTQHAIVEHPSQILVGNVGFDDPHSFHYISAYIVLDENRNSLVYYDFYQDAWVLNNSVINAYDIFPKFNDSINLNGFVNDKSGLPEFYSSLGVSIYYDEDEWKYASYKGPRNNIGIGYAFNVNMNDLADYDETPRGYISAWYDHEYGYFGGSNALSLVQGDMKSLNTDIVFTSNFTAEGIYAGLPTGLISGQMKYASCYKKIESSPEVLSGPPCLGFYGEEDGDIYAIGSVVLGTSNHNIELIGTNHLTTYENKKYIFPSIAPIHYNFNDFYYSFVNDAYWWLGTSVNRSGDIYNLYKITTSFWHYDKDGEETIYKDGHLILLKNDTNPFRAQQLWHCDWSPTRSVYEINDYSPFSPLTSGTLHFEAFPSGNNIDLEVLGMCDLDANFLKKGEIINDYLYVGNWLSPQVTFENEEEEE